MSKISNWLIQKATDLENSSRYFARKKFIYDLIENEYSGYRNVVDIFLSICVIGSVGIALYDLRSHSYDYISHYAYTFSVIFSLEYILRFWVCSDSASEIIILRDKKRTIGKSPSTFEIIWTPLSKKLEWMSRTMNIVDFLSIFPQFTILRLFKLFRYTRGGRNLFSVFHDRRQEVSILVMLIFIAVLIAASLFYYFERNSNIKSYFDAIYWAVITITTVGYGDIAPTTTASRILAMFLVFGGLGIIAMLTSIVTAGLTQKLQLMKQQDALEFIEKSKSFIVIVGYCKVSMYLCKLLKDNNNADFVIIEKNEEQAKKAYKLNYNVLIGDGTNCDDLLKAYVDCKATHVVCLTGSDISNISVAISVRSLGSKVPIITRCIEAQNKPKMQAAGIDHIIDHFLIAMVLSKCIDAPLVFKAISSMTFSMNNDSFNFKDIYIDDPSNISLADISKSCIIIGVFKNNNEFCLNPDIYNFKLEAMDTIVVFGKLSDINRINRFFQGTTIWHKF